MRLKVVTLQAFKFYSVSPSKYFLVLQQEADNREFMRGIGMPATADINELIGYKIQRWWPEVESRRSFASHVRIKYLQNSSPTLAETCLSLPRLRKTILRDCGTSVEKLGQVSPQVDVLSGYSGTCWQAAGQIRNKSLLVNC